MKNLTVTVLRLAGALLLIVVMLSPIHQASAAATTKDSFDLEAYKNAFGTTPEEEAQKVLNKAAEQGIIESQWLEDFEPGKVATYGDFADMAYNLLVLKNTGWAEAKNHSRKKAMKWLKSLIVDAAFENPKDASNLINDYTDGRGNKFKSSGKITYHWAGVVSTVLLYGDAKYGDELWQEGLTNLALEKRERWAYFRSSERMTRIELLEYVLDTLCPMYNAN